MSSSGFDCRSEGRKIIRLPVEFLKPVFIAFDKPSGEGCRKSFKLFILIPLASVQVSSVEPSSTKIISLLILSFFNALLTFKRRGLMFPASFLAGRKIVRFILL